MNDKTKKTRKTTKGRKAAARQISDRSILKALVSAAVEQVETVAGSMNWKWLQFDESVFEGELLRLTGPVPVAAKRRLKNFASAFASRYHLRMSLAGDLRLPGAEQQTGMPRWLVGEALGALGSNLVPTRQRARRTASEAARELAYFGYGQLADQLLPHPIGLVRGALAGEDSVYLEPVLLVEQGPSLGHSWSIFDLLKNDSFFHREVTGEPDLARFQQRLREDPLDGNTVVKLREFFSKRATVGLRDTSRWALGSRHPWFGWERARELLAETFERWGTENFLCPRVSLYAYDTDLDERTLEATLEANAQTVQLFADQLGQRLASSVGAKIGPDVLIHLAHAALDCHHDHPDFDLEARGRQGGETTARFMGHALYVMATNATGKETKARRNMNLAAHFAAKGVERSWLAELSDEERASFYLALNDLIKDYDTQDGLGDGAGRTRSFERIPLLIYTFFESPSPRPRESEEVLDSFTLADLREPQHAKHLHDNPEVFEKLVVFFTLVLRHYLDTDHVPDLRPENLVRDFMFLGLWGTNSPNVVINLYKDKSSKKTRSEVRFVGRSQVKAYRPGEDRKHEAALARLMASQLGPLLEPSVLRAVGTFLMAAEESVGGSRVQEMGPIALAKHTLELFREAARVGIKGGLVDVATLLEMLVDNSVDFAQRGLDRFTEQTGPVD